MEVPPASSGREFLRKKLMTRELAWGQMVTGQIDTCITDSSLDGVDSPIIFFPIILN